ncbi:MAG: tetratricopeptide repeat protein [Flavobacteriales bacterium]|nr:tetratricopeptide repeat protein [Flavobacteriales bacterium]
MRKTLFTLTLLLATLAPLAQSNLDSLYSIWQDKSRPDTSRLLAIQELAFTEYLFSNLDSAFYFAELQYDFAKSKDLKRQMAMALTTQGICYWFKGDNSNGLERLNQSLTLFEELKDKRGMPTALNSLGGIHYNLGQYPKALEYFQRSLTIADDIQDKRAKASALANIGNVYIARENTVSALEYLHKALALQKELNYSAGEANTMNAIGSVYIDEGDNQKGLEYISENLAYYEEQGDQMGKALALNNIGIIYNDLKDYSKALEYSKNALSIYKEHGDNGNMCGALLNIGEIYANQTKHTLALEYCKEALALAEESGVIEFQKTACQCIYNAYKALGKGNEALVYLEKMNLVDDSLNAEETTKKLQQMEFEKQMLADSLATAEEARLVEETHKEEVRKKNKTRNALIGGGLFLFLIAGGIYSRLRFTRKAKAEIEKEKDRSENLLLNILPADIAAELKEKGKADARDFEMVSILFTDFKGFTAASEKLSAQDLVLEINTCFEAFDGIMGKYGIEKIKTIGDAYMAAGGLPVPTDDSVQNTVLAALEMQAFISDRKSRMDTAGKPAFEMRVGIHTGPVVAGIVGVKKFQYDIWGDTVNTASRMESSGEVGKVNISEATYDLIRSNPQFAFENRGKIEAKGKGEMEMWFASKA